MVAQSLQMGGAMANNVDTHIDFDAINDRALNALSELFADPPEYESGFAHIDYAMMKILKIADGKDFDPDDKMGSNWVYIEDSSFDEGNCYLRLVSAWDAPIKAVRILFSYLAQFDKNLIASLRYDDGGHDFGWMVLSWGGGAIATSRESLEREDLAAMVAAADPVFAKMDEDDDEYGEYLDDNFYEYFHDYVNEKIREAISKIKRQG